MGLRHWRRNDSQNGGGKSYKKNFCRVLPLFVQYKTHLVVWWALSWWSVHGLLFFYSRRPRAQTFVKARALWSRRYWVSFINHTRKLQQMKWWREIDINLHWPSTDCTTVQPAYDRVLRQLWTAIAITYGRFRQSFSRIQLTQKREIRPIFARQRAPTYRQNQPTSDD